MKCLKCGKDIPSGAAFCPWCGDAVRKSAPQTGRIPDDIRLDALKRAAARAAGSQAHQTEKNPQPSAPSAAKAQPSAPAATASTPNPSAQPKPAPKSPFMGFFLRTAFLSLSAYMIFNGMAVPGIILLVITLAVIWSK